MSVLSSGGAGPPNAIEVFDEEAADRLRAALGKLSRRLRTTVAPAGVTPSQISTQLCELGLIRRELRSDDRRAATVVATATGRRLRRRVHVERARALSEYVQELDEAQRAVLLDAIPVLEILAERAGERGR
jgi:hypothetical protein